MRNLIAMVALAALVVPASAATLRVTLEVDPAQPGTGNEFDVKVYGEVIDDGLPQDANIYGIADFEITLYTPTTDNKAVPKQGKSGFGVPTGKVVITWALGTDWQKIDPLWQDWTNALDPDGDVDAVGMSAAEQNLSDIGVGVGAPSLLATQRWICEDAAVPTPIEVFVLDGSQVYDTDEADYRRPFDHVVGIGATANVPEPTTIALVALGGLLALSRRRRS